MCMYMYAYMHKYPCMYMSMYMYMCRDMHMYIYKYNSVHVWYCGGPYYEVTHEVVNSKVGRQSKLSFVFRLVFSDA